MRWYTQLSKNLECEFASELRFRGFSHTMFDADGKIHRISQTINAWDLKKSGQTPF